MTTFASEEVKCALCGKTSTYQVLKSTNTFGGTSDLDLRPAEMQRSTMPVWIQVCPQCGYVSEVVSDKTSITKEYVASGEYHSCWGYNFKSDLAKDFFRYHKINLMDNNPNDAFLAIRNAAWACDDADDVENARKCRRIGIELLNKMIGEDSFHSDQDKETAIIVKADLMRRAEMYDEVILEYSNYHNENDLLLGVVGFQVERAGEKDTARYTISDVIGDHKEA